MAETGDGKAMTGALVGAHRATPDDPYHGALAHGESASPERPEDWGWHHQWRRTTPVVGWLAVIALLLMTFGNHVGNVENLYLVGGAAFMALLLVRSQIARRNAWRD